MQILVAPDGSRFLAADRGEVDAWDLQARKSIGKFRIAPAERVHSLTAEGSLFTVDPKGGLLEYDVLQGTVKSKWVTKDGNAVRIYHQRWALFRPKDDRYEIWDLPARKKIAEVKTDFDALGISPDGTRLYAEKQHSVADPQTQESTIESSTLVVIEIPSGRTIKTATFKGCAWSFSVDPSGRTLGVWGLLNNHFTLLDASNLQELDRFKVEEVKGVVFSPDGRVLALNCLAEESAVVLAIKTR